MAPEHSICGFPKWCCFQAEAFVKQIVEKGLPKATKGLPPGLKRSMGDMLPTKEQREQHLVDQAARRKAVTAPTFRQGNLTEAVSGMLRLYVIRSKRRSAT